MSEHDFPPADSPSDSSGDSRQDVVDKATQWGKKDRSKSSSGDDVPPDSLGERAKKFAATIFVGFLFVAMALGAVFGANWFSHSQFDHLRQLQSAPELSSEDFDGGEVRVEGTAVSHGHTRSAPLTNTDTLAYRYRHTEEIERDDETETNTVRSTRRATNFAVETDDGETVIVQASGRADDIEFRYEHRSRERDRERGRRGRRITHRHTERRIDPGDDVFVFGYARPSDDDYAINFTSPGDYSPVISAGGESRHWAGRLGWTLLGLIASLVSILFAVFFFFPIRDLPLINSLYTRLGLDESMGYCTRGYLFGVIAAVIITAIVHWMLLAGVV